MRLNVESNFEKITPLVESSSLDENKFNIIFVELWKNVKFIFILNDFWHSIFFRTLQKQRRLRQEFNKASTSSWSVLLVSGFFEIFLIFWLLPCFRFWVFFFTFLKKNYLILFFASNLHTVWNKREKITWLWKEIFKNIQLSLWHYQSKRKI